MAFVSINTNIPINLNNSFSKIIKLNNVDIGLKVDKGGRLFYKGNRLHSSKLSCSREVYKINYKGIPHIVKLDVGVNQNHRENRTIKSLSKYDKRFFPKILSFDDDLPCNGSILIQSFVKVDRRKKTYTSSQVKTINRLSTKYRLGDIEVGFYNDPSKTLSNCGITTCGKLKVLDAGC